MSDWPSAAELIHTERVRQIVVEGYTAAHDSRGTVRDLVEAASAYTFYPDKRLMRWPWPIETYKPRDRFSNLVRGGALLEAAVDLGTKSNDRSSIWAPAAVGAELIRVTAELQDLLDAVKKRVDS